MSETVTGPKKSARVLRIILPVTAVLTVAAAGVCGVSALDTSVRGGYFYSGSALPVAFYILLALCGAAAALYALLALPKDSAPNGYFTLSRYFALLPAAGIALCLFGTARSFTTTLDCVASLVCLCAGLVYYVSAPFCDAQKIWRFITGLTFMLWPVLHFVYAFLDWYVPLNSPSKLLYQFALLALAYFICEELRAESGASNGRMSLAASAACAVLTACAAVFLTAGGVTYPVAGGTETVCLLLCAAVYAGARWYAVSHYSENTLGARMDDSEDAAEHEQAEDDTDLQNSDTEDENNAG